MLKFILYIGLGMIFGATLTSVVAIATWQFWVIFLMWVLAPYIDLLIDVICG